MLISDALEAFLIDREASNASDGTLNFYSRKIAPFVAFLAKRGIKTVPAITANEVRAFLVSLKEGHNPGGVHAFYRAIGAFCRWLYWEEELPKDIMKRVKAPRVPEEVLAAVTWMELRVLLEACNTERWYGARDYAALLTLLDTGLRASELLSLNVGDVDGEKVVVRETKSKKPRVVCLGARAQVALARHLAFRVADHGSPLWTTHQGIRLSYGGLRKMVCRRAKDAGIKHPPLHAFRRGFAINCFRNGMDLETIRRLMGHSNLGLLRRYLALTSEDLVQAHKKASPVDNLPPFD
jgi:site-specific recombinase XerD